MSSAVSSTFKLFPLWKRENACFIGSCLQSNLVDPAERPKIGLPNRGFWEHFVSFPPPPKKKAGDRVHLRFFSPDPGNLLNLIFRDWPDLVSFDL